MRVLMQRLSRIPCHSLLISASYCTAPRANSPTLPRSFHKPAKITFDAIGQ